jgi:ParB family chromosome partitioning protein
MSRRRAFAIDAPPAPPIPSPAAEAPPRRRGPMAAAVAETAGALAGRMVAEAAARAENDRLAAEHVAARDAGLVLRAVDPDAIEAGWLHRDRAPARDPEIDALKASIAAVGLSNPIRLAELGPSRFGLVQGWRRLTAWRELRAETADPAYAAIPAAVAPAEAGPEGVARAYRRMVDENLARRDVSFAEMAALARAYAEERAGDGDPDVSAAVDALFASAGAQKRSYIRAFAELLDRAEHALEHPAALPRALGLAVRKRLTETPHAALALWDALRAAPGRGAEEELAILRAWVEDRAAPAPRAARAAPVMAAVRARLDDRAEAVARGDRVALRLAAPPAGLDPDRLRAALAAFLAEMEAGD